MLEVGQDRLSQLVLLGARRVGVEADVAGVEHDEPPALTPEVVVAVRHAQTRDDLLGGDREVVVAQDVVLGPPHPLEDREDVVEAGLVAVDDVPDLGGEREIVPVEGPGRLRELVQRRPVVAGAPDGAVAVLRVGDQAEREADVAARRARDPAGAERERDNGGATRADEVPATDAPVLLRWF